MDIEPQVMQGRQNPSPALLDRLDPVLGEASSGIGMMLTELIRRTLRGGIQRVDEELQSVVDEKVDGAVSVRLPSIEAAAAQTAQQTATLVAAREVAALDQRTSEVTARLATELAESHQQLETHARELASSVERRGEERIVEEVGRLERRAEERLTETAGRLASEVAQLETRANDFVTREIASVEQRTTTAAQNLVTREIDSVEQRSETRAREILEEEVAALKERSRLASQTLTKNVNALTEMQNALRELLDREKADRAECLARLDSDLRTRTDDTQVRVLQELNRAAERWKQLWSESEAARQELEARVAELERPRGIRAFAARLFSRKKTEDIPSVVDAILEDREAAENMPSASQR